MVAQTTSFNNSLYGSLTKSNVVKAVSPGQTAFLGTFKQRAFNDASEKVQLTYLTSSGSAIGGSSGLKIEVLYLEQT